MFFFGWGKRNKVWQMPDGRSILCVWDYFDIFFCPVSSNKKWFILSDKRSEDVEIKYDELQAMYPMQKFDIGFWNKYGLFVAIVAIVILGVVGE